MLDMLEVYKNPWFKVIKQGQYHFIEEENADNGAVVLPFIADNLLLIEVYRPAHQSYFLEAPRGYGKGSEDSLMTALRELEEETGYLAPVDAFKRLGSVRPNTAILTSCIDVYMVRLDKAMQISGQPSNKETHHLRYFPINEISQMLTAGSIQDGFTISALALYWAQGL